MSYTGEPELCLRLYAVVGCVLALAVGVSYPGD